MEAMDPLSEEHILPAQYNFTPLRALRVASRRKLSTFLDLEGNLVVVNIDGIETDVVNDYNGLAELAGFSYQEIMNMKRQKSPTQELLELWTSQQDSTVGNLWMYLYMMKRYDVLTECRRPILHDCKKYEEHQQLQRDTERYNIEQDPTVSTSEMKVDETKYATLQDVQSGQITFYDAFICYSAEDESDRKFLYDLIDELEKRRGLKLFVPGRDDLPGAAEHTITAYLIEKRCTRVIILMSKTFFTSAACDFQLKFAHALAPGARSKKLIPVIREKHTPIPRILRFLAVCDFAKADMVEWIWNRLYAAITAPTDQQTYFEEEDSSSPLQDIKFPTQCRLDENADTFHANMDLQSENGCRSTVVNAIAPREPVEHSVTSMSVGESSLNSQERSNVSTSLRTDPPDKSMQKRKTGILQKLKGLGKQPKQARVIKPKKTKGNAQKDSERHSFTDSASLVFS